MRLVDAARTDRRDVALVDGRLAGDVEPNRHDRRPARAAESAKDDAGRLGIVPDVELGARRHIARVAVGAAHDDEPLDESRQFGIAHHRESDIGQGTGGDEDEPPGMRMGSPKNGVDGVAVV